MENREQAEVIKRVREIVERDPEKAEQIRSYSQAAKPILDELSELDYRLQTLGDLRRQGKPWKSALPVLLRWLPLVEDPGVKEDIVRSLSVPWVGSSATAQLIDEFRRSAVSYPSLAWAIGNALSIVSVKGFEKQIVELCANPKYGMARQMLVLGLGRFRGSDAEEAAVELLNDEDVKLHAIGALGKMKSKRALFELERLLTDRRPAVRKEARKAITQIMR